MSTIWKRPISGDMLLTILKLKGWWKFEHSMWEPERDWYTAEHIVEVVNVYPSIGDGFVIKSRLNGEPFDILGERVTSAELLAVGEADEYEDVGDLGYIKVAKHKYGRSI